jgi:2-oxoglutarate ferredoxin oxidoreductase subunit alpha
VSLSAVRAARAEGIPVGLFRPISLSPFPFARLEELAAASKGILVVEMNAGQMLRDVQLAVKGKVPVEFYGRLGGVVPFPDEVLDEIRRMQSAAPSTGQNARDRWINRMQFSNN